MDASHAAQISSDPLDFVRLVLYVRKGVPACETLLSHVSDRMDILIQDVDKIQGPRPDWLRGIPTVVTMPERSVHIGSKAIDCVLALGKDAVRGISAVQTSKGGIPHGGAPIEPEGELGMTGFKDLFTIQTDDTKTLPATVPDADGKYEDAPKTKTHEITLEELMRMRG